MSRVKRDGLKINNCVKIYFKVLYNIFSGQTPPTPLPLEGLPLIEGLPENKPSYEPELKPSYEPDNLPPKFVYICADPNDCPRG